MGAIAIIIFGIATAMNLGVIKMKLEHDRNADAALDFILLVLLTWIFGGTITGLAVATIASSFISLYLYVSPPDKLINKYTKRGSKRRKRRRV
jgi:Na+/H+-translocating membrane pyrophosphatase